MKISYFFNIQSVTIKLVVDFNVILDTSMDGIGGKPKLKESCKKIENLCSSFDLIDIWRIRNPEVQRFTWRQKNPIIQRRLDFWLVKCRYRSCNKNRSFGYYDGYKRD